MEDDAIPKTPAGPSISASHFAGSTPAGTFESNPNSTGSTPAFALTSGSRALPGLGAPAFASPWSQPVTPHSAIMNSLGSFPTPNTLTPLPMTPLAPLSTVPTGRALPSPVGPPPDLALPVARAPSPSPHASQVARTTPAVLDTPEPKRQRIDQPPNVKPPQQTCERVDEMNLIANRLLDLIKPTIGPHFIFPVGGEQTLNQRMLRALKYGVKGELAWTLNAFTLLSKEPRVNNLPLNPRLNSGLHPLFLILRRWASAAKPRSRRPLDLEGQYEGDNANGEGGCNRSWWEENPDICNPETALGSYDDNSISGSQGLHEHAICATSILRNLSFLIEHVPSMEAGIPDMVKCLDESYMPTDEMVNNVLDTLCNCAATWRLDKCLTSRMTRTMQPGNSVEVVADVLLALWHHLQHESQDRQALAALAFLNFLINPHSKLTAAAGLCLLVSSHPGEFAMMTLRLGELLSSDTQEVVASCVHILQVLTDRTQRWSEQIICILVKVPRFIFSLIKIVEVYPGITKQPSSACQNDLPVPKRAALLLEELVKTDVNVLRRTRAYENHLLQISLAHEKIRDAPNKELARILQVLAQVPPSTTLHSAVGA